MLYIKTVVCRQSSELSARGQTGPIPDILVWSLLLWTEGSVDHT